MHMPMHMSICQDMSTGMSTPVHTCIVNPRCMHMFLEYASGPSMPGLLMVPKISVDMCIDMCVDMCIDMCEGQWHHTAVAEIAI